MKDTFGNEIEIGSIVLYCVRSTMGSEYNIGKQNFIILTELKSK